MGIKQLYNDNLRKLSSEYGDVSVINSQTWRGNYTGHALVNTLVSINIEEVGYM